MTIFFSVRACTLASIFETYSFIVSYKLGLYVLKLQMSKQVKIVFTISPDTVAVTNAQFCKNSFPRERGKRAEMTFSIIAVHFCPGDY